MAAAAGGEFIPSPQQKFVIDYVRETGNNLLLFHETGTGKTKCAVACAKALLRKGMRGVVLICPLAVQGQWEKEFIDFGIADKVHALITIQSFHKDWLDGDKAYKTYLASKTVLIIDEAHMIRNTELLDDEAPRAPGGVIDIEEEVANADVINRSLKAENKYKSEFIRSLIEYSDLIRELGGVVLALSATPMVNAASDFSIYFRVLINPPYDARRFMYNDEQFDARFFDVENFKTLACGLASYYKNEKKTVEEGWAPVNRVVVPVPLSLAQEERYKLDSAKRKIIRTGNLQSTQDTFLVFARRWFLRNTDKMAKVVEFILAHPGKKHVVYSNFVKDGVMLFKSRFAEALDNNAALRDMPYLKDPCVISASTPARRRKSCVEMFNLGSSHVILLGSAGREGIDFKGAEYMHILDLPWSQADVMQIEGRVSRRGAHGLNQRVEIRTYISKFVTIDDSTPDVALQTSILKKQALIEPYIAALAQVSIEKKYVNHRLDCPRVDEKVLELNYYPKPRDALTACQWYIRNKKPLSAECIREIENVKSMLLTEGKRELVFSKTVIPAMYSKIKMPQYYLYQGVMINRGLSIDEYRKQYIHELTALVDAMDRGELSRSSFIEKKLVLDKSRDTVLPKMYQIIKKHVDSGGKEVGEEEDVVIVARPPPPRAPPAAESGAARKRPRQEDVEIVERPPPAPKPVEIDLT
jgi:superfamily II DNA or RNA helicase